MAEAVTVDEGAQLKQRQRRAMIVAFLTLFLDLLGFGVILPIQPFYAESFGASATVVTLIGAAYSLMQFLFAPMWGRLSDRVGRRPVVLISIAFACAGWLILGFASGLWMLVAARAVAGFGNANLGTVQAIVADVTRPEDRARGMGLIGAAFGLGFLFGPVVGGIFGGLYGPTVPAFIACGLAVVNWLFAFFMLPETRKAGVVVDNPHLRRSIFPFSAMREAWRIESVAPLLLLGFVFTVGFSLMESALSLFVERQFVSDAIAGIDPAVLVEHHKTAARLTMFVLVTVGIAAVIVQGGLIRPLRSRYSEKQLIIAGSLLITAGFLAVAAVPFTALPFWAMLPIAAVIAVGSGVLTPSSSSLLSRSVDETRQCSVLGVGQAASSLGRFVGPASSGFLLDLHRSTPFLVGAVLLVIAAGLATRVKTTDR
jgi:MFS family permease